MVAHFPAHMSHRAVNCISAEADSDLVLMLTNSHDGGRVIVLKHYE